MYRWELSADDNPVTPTPEPVIPEPATALLLSGGLMGTLFFFV
jgi:hypothetical protein